jgi:charged multivesicular body protein 2A
MKSQQAMAQAMNNVTRTMRIMNRQMNLPAMQKIMTEFEKQGDIAEMKQEMMEDAMEDAMGVVDEQTETDALVNQVFDEVGISFAQQLSPTPVGTLANASCALEDVSDADLKARLESLRRA